MAIESSDRKTFKIGEVCRLADLQPYVLRYWETEFPALASSKSGGGQRLYTQHEVDLVLRIKQLLYTDGFTIAGAKKKLETDELPPDQHPSTFESAGRSQPPSRMDVEKIRRDLREVLEILSRDS
jgi:DNA-binding transcriptional MerR regulator